MSRLREKFMSENEGKHIRLIFSNGFQLSGKLVEWDEDDIVLDTLTYCSSPVTIPQASVNVFIPYVVK